LDVNKRIQFYWEVGCYNPYSDEAMGLTPKECWFDSWWGTRSFFCKASRLVLGPTGTLLGVNFPGHSANPSPPSSAKVKME
jgi:hypothetical protein